ncbi:MAG TPA: transcription elongation factor GreA [Symbiobacteriaceae bacterium]
MFQREIAITPEGLRRMEEELCYLRTVRRQEVAERIKQARSLGDITNNPEYEDAKNEQAFVEGRIQELEETLRKARVIEAPAGAGVVTLGSRVILKDLEYGDVLEYTVVGAPEADPLHNRISDQCPVGQAIMGQKPGTVVEVEAPAGKIRYQILAVQ